MDLPEKSQGLRRIKDLTQKEVADRAGIQHAEVCRIERATRRSPRIDTIKKLASALEVPTGFLADDDAELVGGSLEICAQTFSLDRFLRDPNAAVPDEIAGWLRRLVSEGDGESTVEGWRKLCKRLMTVAGTQRARRGAGRRMMTPREAVRDRPDQIT